MSPLSTPPAKLKGFQQAQQYLESQLPRSDAVVWRGQAGLRRARKFFAQLGNPQDKLKVVHIAGTSGKGTTASLISQLLTESGFKVGMTLSPHVYDIRERCQINNQPISKQVFVQSLNRVIPAINKLSAAGEQPSYFEVLVGLAFLVFVRGRVDFAVIETGLGGLLDATNTIGRADKVCVLTKIGYDHSDILGRNLQAIAGQKAGIIQNRNHTIALKQRAAVNAVFAETAARQQSRLELIEPAYVKEVLGTARLDALNDQLWGGFQLENVCLALATANYLAKRDKWDYNQATVKAAITKLELPGRFEQLRSRGKVFILDGAHNQQKLDGLLEAMKARFKNQPFGLILALRRTKSIPA